MKTYIKYFSILLCILSSIVRAEDGSDIIFGRPKILSYIDENFLADIEITDMNLNADAKCFHLLSGDETPLHNAVLILRGQGVQKHLRIISRTPVSTSSLKIAIKYGCTGFNIYEFNASLSPLVIVHSKPVDNQPLVTFSETPQKLLSVAEESIRSKTNYNDGIDALNQLELMATNQYSQRGLELLGLLYERSGSLDKAKHAYQRYLEKYPNSDDTRRVRERLITLEITDPDVTKLVQAGGPRLKPVGKDVNISSSISEFGFVDFSTDDKFGFKIAQSSIITNFRSSGTFKDDEWTTKYQLRYTDVENTNSASRTILSSAYVTEQNTFDDYGIKLGRQSPSMGVLGRFDGVVTNVGITQTLKLYTMSGVPWNGSSSSNDTKRWFYGAGAEWTPMAGLNVQGYFNKQYADGLKERQAFGSVFHYYNNGANASLTTEYDTLYHKMNELSFQSQIPYQRNMFFTLYDQRTSPVLYADRSLLIGFDMPGKQAFTSVGDVINNSHLTTDQIYNFISNSSSIVRTFVLGDSYKLTDKWTVESDIQGSSMTGTIDTVFVPSPENQVSQIQQQGTGTRLTYNASLSGENVLKRGDSYHLIGSSSRDMTSKNDSVTGSVGQSFGKHHFDLLGKYLLNEQPLIRNTSDLMSFRWNYHPSTAWSFDGEYSVSRTKTFDDGAHTKLYNVNQMIYGGFVYDF